MVHPLLSDYFSQPQGVLHLGCYYYDLCPNLFCFVLFFFKAEKAQQREKNLEEAKKITIKEDPSLPPAQRVSSWLISIFGQVELACYFF